MAKAKSQPHAIPSPTSTSTGADGGSPVTSHPEVIVNLPSTSTAGAAVPGTTVPRPPESDNTSSHNISISSITTEDEDQGVDDDGGSSAFESSSSEDECDNEQITKALERIPNTLQPGTSQLVRLPEAAMAATAAIQERPNIGSIAVQNSSDITFGNKTYIKGQVVIKNIYHDRKVNGVGGGVVNEGYRETDGEAGLPGKDKKDPSSSSSQPAEPLTWRSSLKTIIRDKPLLSAIILMALMLTIVTIATVVYVTTSAADDFLPDAKPLRIVTRNEWLAQPAREKLDDLKLPVHKVIIAHTATEECTTQSACTYRVRFIQDRHIGAENYGDIGYNFLIGGDGNVYEGRGWLKVGAFLRGQNSKSEGIAFIGDYRHITPTKAQMEVLDALLANGTRSGYLTPDFRLHGACQLQATESPGRLLYTELKKHPHWSDELELTLG